MTEGILLVDKIENKTSFSLVFELRKITGVQKIGHAGTLDPFATGLMVMLIGKKYTRMSNSFLNSDKEYIAKICLGKVTDTYDIDGQVLKSCDLMPGLEQIKEKLALFEGEIKQVPPMFSAKKIGGQKLYHLARKGISIERRPKPVTLSIKLLEFTPPFLFLDISCSSGTYIRSLAYDLGEALGCGAYLHSLRRVRAGNFHIKDAVAQANLFEIDFSNKLITI